MLGEKQEETDAWQAGDMKAVLIQNRIVERTYNVKMFPSAGWCGRMQPHNAAVSDGWNEAMDAIKKY
jgi:hypothetical protein